MGRLSAAHIDILEGRGLDPERLASLGVESSDELGPDTIAIPYWRDDQRVGMKFRTIAGAKRFSQQPGSAQILYNLEAIRDPGLQDQAVIVTEGEIDCWAALQAGFQRSVSVPNGAPMQSVGERSAAKYEYLADMAGLPDDAIVILATDDDDPGRALRADLALRLGARRCKWLKYPKGCKDLGDALRLYGTRGVVETISRAQWIVGNVYRMSDIPATAHAAPHDSGFPGLSAHYRLRLGDLCVVTGVPSHGKSAFVGDLVCRMALQHKWRVCFASFEQQPTLDHRRMLRSWRGGGLVNDLDDETLRQADEWIEEHFSFVVPDGDSYPTFAWVMDRFAAAALRYGTRLFVIDPWNELEHDHPKDVSMTEYVGACLRDIKAFARKYEAHMIVVAHPAKLRKEDGKLPIPTLYDIADSAMWANKADVGIVVHREGEEKTIIRVAKSRYHDQIGKTGEAHVRYIWQRSTYEAIPVELPERWQDR